MTVVSLSDARLRRQARQGREPWLNKKQIATYLEYSPRWIELRVREGMPCTRMGGQLRFRVTQVESWLHERNAT